MNSSAQQKFYAVTNNQEMQRRAEKPEPEWEKMMCTKNYLA